MKVAVLFSGGKDSTFALKHALDKEWNVKYLITMEPERDDSWMFHHPCTKLTSLQSQALGIKHIIRKTNGLKASTYQKSRIDCVCDSLGLRSISPLWGKDQSALLEDMIDSGMDIIFVGVSCGGLDDSWLGRILDSRALGDLKAIDEEYGINIAGEGGEYETFVIDAPFFKKMITFEEVERMWDPSTSSGTLRFKGAKLIDK